MADILVPAARFVVTLFGIAVFVLSVWGMAVPAALIGMVRQVVVSDYGVQVAVLARVVLGAALLFAASESLFPRLFFVFGWITIGAALGLAIGGRRLMGAIAAWFDRLSPVFVRVWLVFGLAFGIVMLYGAAGSIVR